MKKFLSKLLVLTLCVVISGAVTVFTGCNNGGDNNTVTDYEHTIVFYSSQGASLKAITENAIEAFEAKYPGWSVEHITKGDYDDVKDAIQTDLQGKVQPDLAYCYPDHVAKYIQTGKVVDMNKFLTATDKKASWNVSDAEGNKTLYTTDYVVGYSEEELADFVPCYFEEGYGKNFGDYNKYGYGEADLLTVPFIKSTEVLYYNKDILKATGNKLATTWDELWAQCKSITDKFSTVTPLGYDSESNWFITMCEQNGWGYTSADSAEYFLFKDMASANWLTQLNGYYKQDYVTTKMVLGNTYTSNLFVKGRDGGIAYCIGSTGGAQYQNPNGAFDWGVAPIPGSVVNGEVVNKAISQGPSLVMLTGGNYVSNPDEKELMTWMFIKELLDPTFQAGICMESGYNSCRYSTSNVKAYQDFIAKGDIKAAAVQMGEYMRDNNYYFTSPAFSTSSEARTQVGNVLYYCMIGEKTPEVAIKEAYMNCGGKNWNN